MSKDNARGELARLLADPDSLRWVDRQTYPLVALAVQQVSADMPLAAQFRQLARHVFLHGIMVGAREARDLAAEIAKDSRGSA